MDPTLQAEIERQEQEQKVAEEKAHERRVRRAYVDVFSTDSGRLVLNDLRKMFYDVDGFVPGNPYDSHGLAAARNVVLRILTVLADETGAPKEEQVTAET